MLRVGTLRSFIGKYRSALSPHEMDLLSFMQEATAHNELIDIDAFFEHFRVDDSDYRSRWVSSCVTALYHSLRGALRLFWEFTVQTEPPESAGGVSPAAIRAMIQALGNELSGHRMVEDTPKEWPVLIASGRPRFRAMAAQSGAACGPALLTHASASADALREQHYGPAVHETVKLCAGVNDVFYRTLMLFHTMRFGTPPTSAYIDLLTDPHRAIVAGHTRQQYLHRLEEARLCIAFLETAKNP